MFGMVSLQGFQSLFSFIRPKLRPFHPLNQTINPTNRLPWQIATYIVNTTGKLTPFLNKAKPQDKEYKKFLEMMKSVNLSISAYDIFPGTPKYAKFFKQMVSLKETNAEDELVTLSVQCSAMIKKDINLPKKLRDPGSCNIQCVF